MKRTKNAFILLALTFACLTTQAQVPARITEVEIFSHELNQHRKILVYTPKFYDEESLVVYDVIYVFDADNREFFDFVHSSVSFVSDLQKRYIVVGVMPTHIDSLNYGRNNDLLPPPVNVDPADFYGGNVCGNRGNFIRYIKNEVIPYINENYRTKTRNIAIGHSLSASFIISCFIEENGLFDDYFAVSPNLAYDKERLLNEFMGFDFDKLQDETFFFISSADEDDYWQGWGPAAKAFHTFANGPNKPDKITFLTKEFPQYSHWPTFAYSMMYALPEYFEFAEKQGNKYSNELYDITITLQVPNESDIVYITGNQPELGEWNPAGLKMEKISPLERRISLKIHSPAKVKFTRGDWANQAWLEGNDGYTNLFLYPEKDNNVSFEVFTWLDEDN